MPTTKNKSKYGRISVLCKVSYDSPLVGMSGKEVQKLIDKKYKGMKVEYVLTE